MLGRWWQAQAAFNQFDLPAQLALLLQALHTAPGAA